MKRNEMVLYYTPAPAPHIPLMKSVLVRMGVRIKNVAPEQSCQTVGWLAGLPGFEEIPETDTESGSQPAIPEELLIMKNFSSRRIDELLMNLRRAGVPRIALKAIVTESNSGWTLYELYTELKKEHEAMTVKTAASSLQTDAGPQKDR